MKHRLISVLFLSIFLLFLTFTIRTVVSAASVITRVSTSLTIPSYHMAVFNNKLYCHYTDTGWSSGWSYLGFYDDTTQSQSTVWNSGNNSASYNYIYYLTAYNNKLYFNTTTGSSINNELWVYDGTSTPIRVADIRTVGSSNPKYLTVFNNKLYFSANGDGGKGTELWVYDGANPIVSGVNPSMVANIYSGATGSNPSYLAVFNNKLYFSANGNNVAGVELWVYDGTNSPSMVADIYSGASNSNPSYLAVFNNKLYFSANGNNGAGVELWTYDGTNLPGMTADIYSGATGSNPAYLTVFNNKLYFQADGNDGAGKALWSFNEIFAPTITSLSLDIGPIAGGSPVVITGTALTGGTVTFGGTAAACTVDSDTQITCTTPAHAAGMVDVTVTTAGGTTDPNNLFTYVAAAQSISPNFGPIAGGTTITITDATGPNFNGATAVTFGGTPAASFTVNSATQITAVTPAHASGVVDVVISAWAGPKGYYNYPAGFTYYGAEIPLALISVPATGSTLPFSESPAQMQVGFNKDVLSASATDPDWASSATNPANYLLVSAGSNAVFDTQTCLAGIQSDDGSITINSVAYNAASYTATLNVNNGQPMPVGKYQLLACGTTSIKDLNGVKLNAGLQDTRFTLVINTAPEEEVPGQPGILPATGFAPDRVTILPEQDVPYAGMDNLWLEIPALGVRMNIVGVPKTDDGWDVSWLGKDAGYLEGSAYPTHEGNSVLTGHVWDSYNKPGPFANLGTLKYGDKIKIHINGQVYTYEVRENRLVEPRNVNGVLKHEELSWVTLLTCASYNADAGSYAFRRMVRAILVSVE